MNPHISPLLTDLYQINMIQAYLDRGDTQTAVFEFFVRTLPARRRFLLAAGLEQALDFLEGLRFSAAEIAWLQGTGRFRQNLIDYFGVRVHLPGRAVRPCWRAFRRARLHQCGPNWR